MATFPIYQRPAARWLLLATVAIGAESVGSLKASAEGECQTRIVVMPTDPADYPIDRRIMAVSGYGDACKPQLIRFGESECRMYVEFEHGTHWLECKNLSRFDWSSHPDEFWNWTSSFDPAQRTELPLLEPAQRISLPPHTLERKSWLAPIDSEGYNISYPIDIDKVISLYPKKIIARDTWKIKDASLPASVQVVTYRTMGGNVRSAIAGRVSFGCNVNMSIYRWSDPRQASSFRGRLDRILAGARLEPIVIRDEKWLANVCKRPSQKPD